MHHRFGAISFATIAMALGALIHINPPGCLQRRFRRLEGILEFFDFFGDNPGPVTLEYRVGNHNANQCKERSENQFASLEVALRVGGHVDEENSRTSRMRVKAELHPLELRILVTDYERKISQRSSALKKRIAAATIHAITTVIRELTNSPILARLLVN